jgi:iron-sulfur cluster assembly accessory protein
MNEVASTNPVVRLTESAAGQVRTLLANEPDNAGKSLRLYVEAGGCSGRKYGLVFDERRENDLVADTQGMAVLIDPASANYLRGTVVDYVDGLNDSGFRISNPNAHQSCGCGRSFEA